MITSVELTESGAAKWNAFFSEHAREGVRLEATTFEMLDRLVDCACMDGALVYELGGRYTNSGRPELFRLDYSDVSMTNEADE